MKIKNKLRIFTSIVQMLFLSLIVIAQEPQKTNGVGEWKQIQLTHLSFCAPKDLKQKDVRCIESGCYEFENKVFSMNIDAFGASRPTFETKLPSYSEEKIWIDESNGVWALIWSFEENTGKQTYHAGALFTFQNRPDYLVNMNFRSTTPDVRNVANKIIKSTKFTKIKE